MATCVVAQVERGANGNTREPNGFQMRRTMARTHRRTVDAHGKFQLLLLCPHTTPFPEEMAILGVISGVLLWADMNAATSLGAWGAL